MEGLHLTADLQGCQGKAELLTSAAALSDLCRSATMDAGLTIVGEHWHKFPGLGAPGGVTGMLLLAESHLAVHTWPERDGVTLDIYVCNFTDDNSHRARAVVNTLLQAMRPTHAAHGQLLRGDRGAPAYAGELLLEPLNATSLYGFRFDQRLLSRQTDHQQLELFESEQFGRTLLLDGRFMTSESDEFFYHEALVHPAAVSHPNPRDVLILGGGDGGAAEEVLKHPSVERITLVDLDPEVVAIAREHLASIHRGALNDPRVRIMFQSGEDFVRDARSTYDLVLLDLTDPETPAGPLYTPRFLRQVRALLSPGGMVVLHLGAPFFEQAQVRCLARTLQDVFARVDVFGLHIPLYGAYWAFAVASRHGMPAEMQPDEVRHRLEQRGIRCLRYYNPQVHGALFALPNFLADLVRAPTRPSSANVLA